MKHNVAKAKKHLNKLIELVSKRKSPFSHMREEEVIEKIRRDREAIWEERFAVRH